MTTQTDEATGRPVLLPVIALTSVLILLGAGCGDGGSELNQEEQSETSASSKADGPSEADAALRELDISDEFETVILYRQQSPGPDSCRYLSEVGRAQFETAGVPSCDAQTFLAYGVQAGADALLPRGPQSETSARLLAPCEAIYTLSRPAIGERWLIDHVSDVSAAPPCV